MITRDPATRNIVITPEDLPAMAGLVLTQADTLRKQVEEGTIPGSMHHIVDQFTEVADLFKKALDSDAGLD